MSILYSKIYDLFKDRIRNDISFYITNETEDVVIEIAKERCKRLMNQAIYNMYMNEDNKDFEINFYDKDDTLEVFNVELNDIECQLIADSMFICYMDEEYVNRIKDLRKCGFEDSEIKIIVNSQANTLKEFMASIDKLKNGNTKKIHRYKRRDRETMKFKRFDLNFE